MRLRFLLVAILLAGGAAGAPADEPVSLVITYRARPETRVAFRAWLEDKGARQFARWRQAGEFSGIRILFSALAAGGPVDAIVILDFARYTDTAHWRKRERECPGGLSPEALQLAAPVSAQFGDVICRGAGPGGDPNEVTCVVAFYEVLTDQARYRDYVHGYVEPQMRGWTEAGVLSGFVMVANQAPLHQAWDAMLLLEYADLAALARRDAIKRDVRAQLAARDPVWVEWSTDKGAVRKELSLFPADVIPVPAAL